MNIHDLIGYPLFAIAAVEIALGVILLTRRRRDRPSHRAAGIMALLSGVYCLTVGIVYVRAALGLDYDFFYRTTWIGWLIIPAALQFIFYVENEASRTARAIGATLYLFWSVVYGLTLFTDWFDPGVESLVPFVDRQGPLELPARVVGSLLLILMVVKIVRIKRRTAGLRKIQLSYFLVGLLIFGVGAGATAAVFQLFGGLALDPAMASYFSLPWTLLTFYAISRYRLFDIRLVLSRATAVALVGVIAALLQISLFRMTRSLVGDPLALVASLAALAAVLYGTPLRQSIQRVIDEAMLRGRNDYQEALKEASHAVVSMLDLDDLLEYLVGIVDRSFRSERIAVLLRAADGAFVVKCGRGLDEAVASGCGVRDGVVDWIEQNRKTFISEERALAPAGVESGAHDEITSLTGAELVVPMIYKGRLLGLLTLGEKASGDPYVESDIELLEVLARQTAVALENARLYELSAQHARDLGEAKEAAEEASRVKSQFLAAMSHEIRTPMHGVLGMLSLLRSAKLAERERRFADTAHRSAEGLLRILNDVLDFSKIESGKLELETADFLLRDNIDDVVGLFADRAHRKGLEFDTSVSADVPDTLRGDSGRLRQILSNMIDNAVKFTECGEISVRVGIAEGVQNSACLRFEVSDTGVGVAPEASDRIFGAFTQADGSTTRKYGGTGLGLAISKELAEMMGGEIGAHPNRTGGGSVFWFTVPLELGSALSAPEPAAGPEPRPLRPEAGKVAAARILLAEDNRVNREVALSMLTGLGFTADAVVDGQKVLEALSRDHYDLVLMDCRMPVMDGYEATRRIRKREESGGRPNGGNGRTPIVALTANAMQGDREQCLAAGMDDYLSKPFQPEQLLGVLRRWLPVTSEQNAATMG